MAVEPGPSISSRSHPAGCFRAQSLELELLVNWPARSVWRGLCPTSQMFDFWIECGGTEIWRWSDGRIFRPVSTARALFVASGQETSESFEVRFLHAMEEAEVGVV